MPRRPLAPTWGICDLNPRGAVTEAALSCGGLCPDMCPRTSAAHADYRVSEVLSWALVTLRAPVPRGTEH